MFAQCSLEEAEPQIASLAKQTPDSAGRMVVIYYELKSFGYEWPIAQGACATVGSYKLSVSRTIETVDGGFGCRVHALIGAVAIAVTANRCTAEETRALPGSPLERRLSVLGSTCLVVRTARALGLAAVGAIEPAAFSDRSPAGGNIGRSSFVIVHLFDVIGNTVNIDDRGYLEL